MLPRRRTITLLAVATALVAASPPGAAAGARGHLFTVAAHGRTQRGNFHGTARVRRFGADRAGVFAAVVLTGVLRDARYPGPVAVRQPLALRVHVGGAGCSAVVSIGPVRTFVWGLPGTLTLRRIRVGGAAGCSLTPAHGRGLAGALERLRRTRG